MANIIRKKDKILLSRRPRGEDDGGRGADDPSSERFRGSERAEGANLKAAEAADAAVVVKAKRLRLRGDRPGRTDLPALPAHPAEGGIADGPLEELPPDPSLQELRSEDERGEAGEAEIPDFRERTVDLRLGCGETHLPGGLQDRQALRVEADHPADGPIEREGIAAGQQHAQLAGDAAHPRSLPLQRQDAVEDVEGRPEGHADPGDEPGERLPVDAGAHMPLRLPVADDATEEVLDGEGQEHLAVGLELGEVHDDVRPDGVLGDLDCAERFADVNADGILERPTLAVEAAKGVTDPAHPEEQVEAAHCGAVGDKGTGAPFVAVFHDGPDDGGMGENGLARQRRGEEVRFDQDATAAPDLFSSHRLHHPEDHGPEGVEVIGRMADDHTHLHSQKGDSSIFQRKLDLSPFLIFLAEGDPWRSVIAESPLPQFFTALYKTPNPTSRAKMLKTQPL